MADRMWKEVKVIFNFLY